MKIRDYHHFGNPFTTLFASLLTTLLLHGVIIAQVTTTWTGAGGNSNWNDAANWSNGIPNNINASSNFSAEIDGGNAGMNSAVDLFDDFSVTSLSISNGDSLTIDNGNSLEIRGTSLDNFGTFSTDTIFNSQMQILLGDGLSINGNGTINLTSGNFSVLTSLNTSGTGLDSFSIQAGQTVQGAAQIGTNVSTITNFGLIQSNLVGGGAGMNLDPGAGGFTNNGILQAATNINGTTALNLLDGIYTNNGIIEAQAGGIVSLQNGAIVRGGTFLTSGDGLIRVLNNNSATIGGTVINNGALAVEFTNQQTTLTIEDGTSLIGDGSLRLNNQNLSRVVGILPASTIQLGTGHTVSGSGQFGEDSMIVTNDGVFDANATGLASALVINPNNTTAPNFGFTNNNTLRASGGGTLELNDGRFDNTSGTIEAADGSIVRLRDGEVIGGQFISSGSGTGTIDVVNGSTGTIGGAILNNATIRPFVTNTITTLAIADGTSLSGSGTVQLNHQSFSRVMGVTPTSTLQIEPGQTVAGGGLFGNDSLIVTNNGVFDANTTGLASQLVINPNNTFAPNFGFTNNNMLRASGGGTLELNDGRFNNAGGIIEAADGSTVQLRGSEVFGGQFLSSGTGTGTIDVVNNSTGTIGGNIVNNATIRPFVTNAVTTLAIADGTSLSGTGTLRLNNQNFSRVVGVTPMAVLQIGAGQTVAGAGLFGDNSLSILNDGVFNADASGTGNRLTIDPGSADFINNNLLTATGGGLLVLQDGTFDNTNGILRADTDSSISFEGSVVRGGTIESRGNGTIYVNNGNVGTLAGSINNVDTIDVGFLNAGTLHFANNTHVQGTGDIKLTFSNISVVSTANVNDSFINGAGHLIHGRGVIGNNNGSLANFGRIISDDGATLRLNPAQFENFGLVEVESGSVLQIDNSYVQTTGATRLRNGVINASTSLEIKGGLLEGTGTINGTVLLDGNLEIGVLGGGPVMGVSANGAIGRLDIEALTMLGNAVSSFDIGGVDQGVTFDFVDVTDGLNLDGDLALTFFGGFESTISSSDQFAILSSGTLTGSFNNVANGMFLTTTDGLGQFRVNYGASSAFDPNSVFLSNFRAVPEPSAGILLTLTFAYLATRRRRL